MKDIHEHIDPSLEGMEIANKVKELKSSEKKPEEQRAEGPDSGDKIFIYITAGIVILVLSVFLMVKFSSQKVDIERFSYNGFGFEKIGNFYYTQVQLPGKDKLHNIEMRNSPFETEKIPIQMSVKPRILNADKIYLTVDPNMTGKTVVGMIEVGRIIGDKNDIFNIPAQSAITFKPEDYDGETPIVDCENSTDSVAVMWFKTGPQNMVFADKRYRNCIIVQGTDEMEIIKSADRLVYYLLGISG